jgi:hypothetical protein
MAASFSKNSMGIDAACRMAQMGKRLTEGRIERYHRDGFVYQVIPGSHAGSLRRSSPGTPPSV